MASVLIREAKEGDCGNILRLIRVRAAGRKPGSQRGSERRCWSGDGKDWRWEQREERAQGSCLGSSEALLP